MIDSASEIVAAVSGGRTTARAVTQAALDRIAQHNDRLGAFTAITGDRALAQADRVDAALAAGRSLPLAGVPFGAKNLFDLEGLPTLAGSRINRERTAASADANIVARLEAAGAVCMGALNMGEYAYDFTGENAHYGPSRNPHDLERMTGGSSGGSASAVAAGLVPLALGSDTNGSIRVPASFCGLFGLKPTYGRLSRSGAFPFVPSLDTVGPLGRSCVDLALAYDAMQGHDDSDPAQVRRPLELLSDKLERGAVGLRIAMAGGYFDGEPETHETTALVASALGIRHTVTLPDAPAARAAAFLVTMAEGASLHIERLRRRPQDFDPAVRDRLLAGAMLPTAWTLRAQKFRRAWRDKVLALFRAHDAIIVPATPMRAPLIGQSTATIGGVTMPLKPNIGVFTQPISFIGLPVVTAPIWLDGKDLPLGVQIVAPPWREDIALRIARQLERDGVAHAPVAKAFAAD